MLAWRGGLRVSEVLALRPKDLDIASGTVVIHHGKGDKSRRVGIDPGAAALVSRWLDARKKPRHRNPPATDLYSQRWPDRPKLRSPSTSQAGETRWHRQAGALPRASPCLRSRVGEGGGDDLDNQRSARAFLGQRHRPVPTPVGGWRGGRVLPKPRMDTLGGLRNRLPQQSTSRPQARAAMGELMTGTAVARQISPEATWCTPSFWMRPTSRVAR